MRGDLGLFPFWVGADGDQEEYGRVWSKARVDRMMCVNGIDLTFNEAE